MAMLVYRRVFPCISKNRGFSSQIIHLFIGFSIIFTIHFQVALFFGSTSLNGFELRITVPVQGRCLHVGSSYLDSAVDSVSQR